MKLSTIIVMGSANTKTPHIIAAEAMILPTENGEHVHTCHLFLILHFIKFLFPANFRFRELASPEDLVRQIVGGILGVTYLDDQSLRVPSGYLDCQEI